jgi:hypothetical protein
MKALRVAYDLASYTKVRAKKSKIQVCQRLPKIAKDPNLVA